MGWAAWMGLMGWAAWMGLMGFGVSVPKRQLLASKETSVREKMRWCQMQVVMARYASAFASLFTCEWGNAVLTANACLILCTGSSAFNTSINFSTVRFPPPCEQTGKQRSQRKRGTVGRLRLPLESRARLCRVRTTGTRCRAETGASSSFFAPSKISSHSFGYFLCFSSSSSCRLLAVSHRCDPTIEKEILSRRPSVYLRAQYAFSTIKITAACRYCTSFCQNRMICTILEMVSMCGEGGADSSSSRSNDTKKKPNQESRKAN